MNTIKMLRVLCAAGLAAAAAKSAHADSVDFEDKTGPANFAGAGPAQSLIYSFAGNGGYTATFTGGVVLTGESNQTTDNSSVYATSTNALVGADPSLTNPLVITFSKSIQNFQIQILNALAGPYLMSDNVGDSMAFTLATTGGSIQTEGFAAAGTQVTIDYTGGGDWDYAIDNVTFNQPLGNSVPDGGMTIGLLGMSLTGLGLLRRKLAA